VIKLKFQINIILILLLVFCFYKGNAQKGIIKSIDSLISIIDYDKTLNISKDSIVIDQRQLILTIKGKVYLTMYFKDTLLYKFENNGNTQSYYNGNVENSVVSSTYYFNNNKLIKLNGTVSKNGKVKYANIYFFAENVLYIQPENIPEDRGEEILENSKVLIQQFRKDIKRYYH
jgi:hypothetical protein